MGFIHSHPDHSAIVFSGGFETLDAFSETWGKTWGVPWMNRGENITKVQGLNGSPALRIEYPKGGVGPKETGAEIPVEFRKIAHMPQKTFDSLYLRYFLKFEHGFDFNKGGKLPGLMGGDESWRRSGGNQPDGTNGWSLRFMWRADGEAVVYSYLPCTKYGSEQWGFDIPLNTSFKKDTWHCLEQFVQINTPGKTDGKLQVWFDKMRVLTLADVTYYHELNDAGKIGGIFFSTFHGGNTIDWAPSVDSHAQFCEIIAAGSRACTDVDLV